MKIFISQPMNGKEAEEIQRERDIAIFKLKAKYGKEVEIIDSFVKDFPRFPLLSAFSSILRLFCFLFPSNIRFHEGKSAILVRLNYDRPPILYRLYPVLPGYVYGSTQSLNQNAA